jgi:hypothetical protein
MFTLSSTHKFYLYTEATDMRFIKPLDEIYYIPFKKITQLLLQLKI